MHKVLPILAIVTSVLAASFVLLMRGGAYNLFPLLALAAAVLLFLRRDGNSVIVGSVVALGALVALLMAAGNVSFKGGSSVGDDQAQATYGWAFALAVGLLVPAAVAIADWNKGIAWVHGAGLAAVLFAWILVLPSHANIGEYFAGANYGVAILALAAGVPAVMQLMQGHTQRS
jgi:hypothetical protein